MIISINWTDSPPVAAGQREIFFASGNNDFIIGKAELLQRFLYAVSVEESIVNFTYAGDPEHAMGFKKSSIRMAKAVLDRALSV